MLDCSPDFGWPVKRDLIQDVYISMRNHRFYHIYHWVAFGLGVGFIAFTLVLLAGCNSLPASVVQPVSSPAPSLNLTQSDMPDATVVAMAYLDAWKAEDYGKMYTLLTSLSQNALCQEEFIQDPNDSCLTNHVHQETN